MSKEKQREQRWKECDFYAALGLAPSASQAEVKKGFRRIALSCHPDKVPEAAREAATRRFQLIAEAYEVLSDAALRSHYDSLRQGRTCLNPPAPHFAPAPRTPPKEPPRQARRHCAEPRSAQQQAQRQRDMNPDRGGGPGRGDPRCEGCDVPTRAHELRRCPQCTKRICRKCDLCVSCIPQECDERPQGERRPLPARFSQRSPGGGLDPDAATDPYQWRPQRGGAATSEAAPRRAAAEQASAARQSEARRGAAEVFERSCRPAGAAPAAASSGSRAGQVPPARSTTPDSWSSESEEEESSEEDEAARLLGILKAMGFSDADARVALRERPTLSAAVAFLMAGGAGAAGGLQRAASGLYGAAETGASGLYGAAIQPAAKGLYAGVEGLAEAVGYLGGQIHQIVARPDEGEDAGSGDGKPMLKNPFDSDDDRDDLPGKAVEVEAALQMLGFPTAQAQAASKRCSSVEAAVEWIAEHPDIEH